MTDGPATVPASSTDGATEVDGAVDLAVPELLLMPLIEVAADVLREVYKSVPMLWLSGLNE